MEPLNSKMTPEEEQEMKVLLAGHGIGLSGATAMWYRAGFSAGRLSAITEIINKNYLNGCKTEDVGDKDGAAGSIPGGVAQSGKARSGRGLHGKREDKAGH